MHKATMNSRIAEMQPALVEQVRDMIRLGYGAHGIVLETHATLKQVNAVFALATGNF